MAWGLAITLIVPVLLGVVTGLGGLLAALGDAGGGRVCGWVGVGLGVTWVTAVVATVVLTAAAGLVPPPRPARRRRRRGRTVAADRLAVERADRHGSA